MHHILESLVRCITPILSFTAEEIWGHMNGQREESVLFAQYYSVLDGMPSDPVADQHWDLIIAVRNEVAKQIEALRVAGDVGSALDAKVSLYSDGDVYSLLSNLGDELRFVLMTSEATLAPLGEAGESAIQSDLDDLTIAVNAIDYAKCVRCWHRRADVGDVADHPELCVRCVSNVDGDGESRSHA